MVIFTCSCQHAAVNFSQMDAYGFQPHSPSLMRKPPPKTKGLANMEHIMNSLPTKDQAGATIGVVFDLTRKFDDEVSMTNFSNSLIIHQVITMEGRHAAFSTRPVGKRRRLGNLVLKELCHATFCYSSLYSFLRAINSNMSMKY